jgi:hypothetical protein
MKEKGFVGLLVGVAKINGCANLQTSALKQRPHQAAKCPSGLARQPCTAMSNESTFQMSM